MSIRTDLAVEAVEFAGEQMPEGVVRSEEERNGVKITRVEVVDEKETYTMYVFNACETQRIIDELYDTFLEHPECYTNDKLNCTVRVGLTAAGFETNYFYPYREYAIEKMVYHAGLDYMVYALDTYENGVFQGTKYICQDNCTPDNPDVISSDTAIMKQRQIK